MRRRLVTSIMGALMGAVAGPMFSANWELSAGIAMAVCALGGAILGYIASMLFDVFTGDAENVEVEGVSDPQSPE